MTKLHLGCGKRILDGWVHIDTSDYDHIDFNQSISDLSMFPDSTVEIIYCSHALEYFDRDQAFNVLKEWGRVLTDSGTLFIAVPDFVSLTQIYSETGKIKNIIGPLFGRMNSGIDNIMIYHKTVYDEESLRSLMQECGFINIERYDPIAFLSEIDKEFDDHSLAFFPHMDRTGIQVSLCLKAHHS
jgi:predicted SAM-dependent methyltransferase